MMTRASAEIHIGLISDTHMPRRWATLPESIADIFHGVDLILHAGDVGELWVLDQLSALAPVVAVHGNDETADAQRELPYQLLVIIAGQRVLLWHSHYQDHIDEMASRHFQAWQPKLDRIAERGRRAGANIVIFGHFHTPLVSEHNGVLLINPGAIASGNAFVRQTLQTVATLALSPDKPPEVRHWDVNDPVRPITLDIDLQGTVTEAVGRLSASIVEPAIRQQLHRLWNEVVMLDQEAVEAVYLPLAHQRWSGEVSTPITWRELIGCMERSAGFSAETRRAILTKLHELSTL
ncbi:MAG: metallophosphatase family protein [Anaerolineae bacterium]|nr:metallophosphatase family protein [Anaerolineae bacterium]